MKKVLAAVWLTMIVSLAASATTYYVSASGGNDSNEGTSQTTPWKTLGKVNAASFSPGDVIRLRRGDTWRESLIPGSSGSSAAYIYFDAYDSGPAPRITGYQNLPPSAWSLVSGNLWQASLTASGVNNASFGTIWGQKQSSQGAVQHDRDFYFSAGVLYVYANGNPVTYYGSVGAITTATGQLIYINGKSWLQFQHISLNWFDGFGVNIAAASDHLVFANMEANGMVPSGTLPHGFYINANSPSDISFYNDEAHLNYDGFRFDGSATGIALVNCKAYANRDGGLVDNTGHATYSYSHFYANNIAIFNSQDVQGGAIDGGHNLPADTPPAVVNFATYPPRVTFTVDDVGFAPGTETYVDSLIPVFNARGLKLSIGVVAGYSSNLISEINAWLAAGHDINSHSWSHQYYTNTSAFTIRYTGTGTAATLSISGNRLTTNVTGGPGGENLDIDLTNSTYDTATELVAAINTHGGYSAALGANCRTMAHTIGLADVSSQDIKSATYSALFQKDRLEPDELTSSRNWLQTNISGLSNAKVFVYPDGLEDTQTQAWAAAAGYEGARGGLSIGLGSSWIYSKGVNIQDITSLSAAGLHGMTAPQIDAKLAALIFKASVWGVPYGLFDHINELTPEEVGLILDALMARGAVIMSNSYLMDWLASTVNVAGTTNYVSPAAGSPADFHLTTASPILNAGSNLGAAYATDLSGVLRPQTEAWDIGAYGHLSTAYGTGNGPGSFAIGSGNGAPLSYAARTDTCELASDTWNGQNCGNLGLALSFHEQEGGTVPNVGGHSGETLDQAHCPAGAWNGSACTRAVNVQYVDLDFHSINIRATDGTDYQNPSGASGGDVQWWAANSTGFFIKSGGSQYAVRYFDPATRTVTASRLVSSVAHGDSTHLAQGGNFSWDDSDPNVIWERDDAIINKLTINRVTDSITREKVIDLADAGANCLPTGYTANWQGNFAATGGTLMTTLAGAPDWKPNQAITDDPEYYILPSTGNAGHYAFQAMTGGTTVADHTGFTWPQSASASICDDGTTPPCGSGIVRWDSINKLWGQEQGFDVIAYKIGQGCRHYNTRTGKITGDWGCSYAAGGTQCSGPANASVVTDNPIICTSGGYCDLSDRYTLHGGNSANDPNFLHLSSNVCLSGSCPGFNTSAGTFYWDVRSNVVRPCNVTGCGGHQAKGYVYEYRGSAGYRKVSWAAPVVNGALNPGTYVDTQGEQGCDNHGSYNNSGAFDLPPLFKFTVNVPVPRIGTTYAYCNEVVAIATDGSTTAYRFASNYNSGSEASFQTQNAIGIVSQDGKWALRLSDMMGTLGDTNGNLTCNQLRADDDASNWTASTAYSLGYRMMPIAGAGIYQIYEVTTAGTSGSTKPAFSSTTVGYTYMDGGVVWTNRGQNNCRADYWITDLMSAH